MIAMNNSINDVLIKSRLVNNGGIIDAITMQLIDTMCILYHIIIIAKKYCVLANLGGTNAVTGLVHVRGQ